MTIETLAEYGWTPFFASQIDPSDPLIPVRVLAVHRNRLHVAAPGLEADTAPFAGSDTSATVGDWLLVEPQTLRPRALLERQSLFSRRAPGTSRAMQPIAANIDTLFIVSSCNQDFSVARLERYLALAREAGVMPVVLLTKADLTDSPGDFVHEAARLMPGLLVEALDARGPAATALLAPWCGRSQTVAVVGSSGVGKSTLVNTLTGGHAVTQAIRDHDETGKHTTTGRMLHRLPAGGWLIDTPGMRELQLADAATGLDDVFAELVDLAAGCRFADCTHTQEPGCAVRQAVDTGAIDADRLRRWKKLAAEDRFNSASLAERRAADRAFGKMAKRVMREKQARRE